MLNFTKAWFHTKSHKNKGNNKIVGQNDFLSSVSPKEGYRFYSDYFRIDGYYASILTFFHMKGSDRNMPPMWGIRLLPQELGPGISARLITSIRAMPDKWITAHMKNLDFVNNASLNEAYSGQHESAKLKANFRNRDVYQITQDVTAGDSYLYVSFKILLKAKTLEKLDAARHELTREYDSRFDRIYIKPFDGQEYDDFSHLLDPSTTQIGGNYMFTSSELSGSYNLLSHGIDDSHGDYCGSSIGDINISPVNWDIDNFKSHVIIAADQKAKTLSGYHFPAGTRGSGMWGVKLAQDAIFNNHKVVHIVLNNIDLKDIGPDWSGITTVIHMNRGAINPFEMFGSRREQLSVYPAHTQKLRFMAKQINSELDSTDLGRPLGSVIDAFYKYYNMWTDDAKHHQKDLRIVGLRHSDYPQLHDFVSYMETFKKIAQNKNEQSEVHSLSKLQGAFDSRMEGDNGDLFDQETSRVVNSAPNKQQVIYDFSGLDRRGNGIFMAQLINALGYAISNLGPGDLLIIHGAERIRSDNAGANYSIKQYVANVLAQLHDDKDVRVAYLYNSIQAMLDDSKFNNFNSADWILTGYMNNHLISQYRHLLRQRLPQELTNDLSSTTSPLVYYLHRGSADNVLFEANPLIDFPR